MTIIKPLFNGSECIQMTLSDGQDEVRVHIHLDRGISQQSLVALLGLVVKNASRGLLYEAGEVVGLDCQDAE